VILALGKARSRREPNLVCKGGWQTGVMWWFAKEACTRAVEWTGALSWWSWYACSVIVKCDGHTVHKLGQPRLTADWLAPRESDCSWMYSRVSSDWLPSYIQATQPVLEIFRMAGYLPDSPHMVTTQLCNFINCDGCRSRQKTRPLLCVLCMAL